MICRVFAAFAATIGLELHTKTRNTFQGITGNNGTVLVLQDISQLPAQLVPIENLLPCKPVITTPSPTTTTPMVITTTPMGPIC